MSSVTAEEVNAFWIADVGPKNWYAQKPDLDETIRSRFLESWRLGAAGALDDWAHHPSGALGLIILLDQFPRNMFRGAGAAFSSDGRALALAKRSLAQGYDLRICEPQRQFFYLPLMHSESLVDQDRCVRLIMTRMPKTGAENLRHAREHRDVIRRFGRFPYRNDALGRRSTGDELAFLDQIDAAA